MCSKVSRLLGPEIAKTRPSGHRKMLFCTFFTTARSSLRQKSTERSLKDAVSRCMAPGANGNFLERSEGRYAPPGLSPTGDWGIIEYSHPVLKDSAQGWLLLNDVFGISGCYCKGSRMIGPEKSFSVLRFVKVLMYVTPSSTYWKFTLSVIQSYLYSLLSRSSN